MKNQMTDESGDEGEKTLRLVGQPGNDRCNKLRLEMLQHVRRHNGLCHRRSSNGRDRVGFDVVFDALASQSLCEAHETHLGSAVVGLTKVAVEALEGASVSLTKSRKLMGRCSLLRLSSERQ